MPGDSGPFDLDFPQNLGNLLLPETYENISREDI